MKLRTVLSSSMKCSYDRAYDLRASIVGFNLPFDISRLGDQTRVCTRQGNARRLHIQASRQWWRPAIQVRHLNARASLIQFTHPPKRRDPRATQAEDRAAQPARLLHRFEDHRGGLLSRSFSLASLADFLKTPTRKAESGGHGKQLTTKYVRYCFRTFKSPGSATRPCGTDMRFMPSKRRRLARSSAKRALARPISNKWACGPSGGPTRFSAASDRHIMSTYFGGRAEVRWRREIRQVLYCDFLSMYPTVCTLMGFWRFVIAQGMEWSDSTEKIRALVNSISLDDLQRPEFWPLLTTIVRVAPQADIFSGPRQI